MKQKIFIDTDIIIDVALDRKDFVGNSRMILSLAENDVINGYTSVVIVSNIYYILKKFSNSTIAKKFIFDMLKYITILSVDQIDIENALDSEFKDFEDAIQFSVSKKNHCEVIVTRNIDDYKLSTIPIMLPIELVKIYKEKL